MRRGDRGVGGAERDEDAIGRELHVMGDEPSDHEDGARDPQSGSGRALEGTEHQRDGAGNGRCTDHCGRAGPRCERGMHGDREYRGDHQGEVGGARGSACERERDDWRPRYEAVGDGRDGRLEGGLGSDARS